MAAGKRRRRKSSSSESSGETSFDASEEKKMQRWNIFEALAPENERLGEKLFQHSIAENSGLKNWRILVCCGFSAKKWRAGFFGGLLPETFCCQNRLEL